MTFRNEWDAFKLVWKPSVRDTAFLTVVIIVIGSAIAIGFVLWSDALAWITYQ